jgi:hypothetical protein
MYSLLVGRQQVLPCPLQLLQLILQASDLLCCNQLLP